MLGVSPDELAALCCLAAIARLVLCIAIVPILAAHGYQLELTWTSVSLTRAGDDKT
jgi:hypothetical protein